MVNPEIVLIKNINAGVVISLRTRKLMVLFLAAFLGLSGCATSNSAPQSKAPRQMGNLLITEPVPVSSRSQMALARLNEVLGQVEKMTNEQRAELLYQRGTHYDSVGLKGLAQYDFGTALKLKPDMAEAHNFMGIHHTQNEDFIAAYDAFDAALELQPDHTYALFNRGIALYYGGRPKLAISDLERFFGKDQSDPYRALWLFIAEKEVDFERAKQNLTTARDTLPQDHWALGLVDFYLGAITEHEVLNNLVEGVATQQELAHRLCEAYFYLGKHHFSNQRLGRASNYFKLVLGTNIYHYVEHRYASLELNLLRDTKFN